METASFLRSMIFADCPVLHSGKKLKNKQKCNLSNYLLKLGKKLQLTLYEHEHANFNFFAKLFEFKGFKYKFEWLGLT